MARDLRLPLLAERKAALETCAYCPKLCRAVCPVSNAEPRDTLTPWGKMTNAWMVARGDLPVSDANAKTAWACTGCFACRDACDHQNPVAHTLGDARAEYRAAGVAPAAAGRVIDRHAERLAEASRRITRLRQHPKVAADAPTALLVGCTYLRRAPQEASQAVDAVTQLMGTVRLVDACCGAPLLYAGDRAGFTAARRNLLAAVASADTLVVVDPGCALILQEEKPLTLVQLAARELHRLGRVEHLFGDGPVRWHDPCKLGRGLGLYEEPRAVLGRVLGRAPDEFDWRRDEARCSGAGGMLPMSMPRTSATIADTRLAEHDRLGGGTVVTACASSLHRLRSRGASVVDLVTVISEGLKGHG